LADYLLSQRVSGEVEIIVAGSADGLSFTTTSAART
jgi:hypothetical protein